MLLGIGQPAMMQPSLLWSKVGCNNISWCLQGWPWRSTTTGRTTNYLCIESNDSSWAKLCKIEKELLVLVVACERFDQYVYGRSIIAGSDHKPLEMISKKPIANAPKGLQRLLLRLQRYDITVVYKKGSEMFLANTLSRAYLKTKKPVPGKLCPDPEDASSFWDDFEVNLTGHLPISGQQNKTRLDNLFYHRDVITIAKLKTWAPCD